MGIVTYPALRRALRRDAKRTQDLQTKRVVGAFGTTHLIVRESESCGGDRIVPNASGASFGPNSQALVATPGGSNSRVVISRPPSGAGSVLAPRTVAKGLPVTQSNTGEALAIQVVASGNPIEIRVGYRRSDGALVTLYDSIVLNASASASLGGSWKNAEVISGSSILPDGSFVLAGTEDGTDHIAYIVDISDGSATAVTWLSGVANVSREIPRWDLATETIYVLGHPLTTRFILKSFLADGTGLAAVQDVTTAGKFQGGFSYAPDGVIGYYNNTSVSGLFPLSTADGTVYYPYSGAAPTFTASVGTVSGKFNTYHPVPGPIVGAKGYHLDWNEVANSQWFFAAEAKATVAAVDLGWSQTLTEVDENGWVRIFGLRDGKFWLWPVAMTDGFGILTTPAATAPAQGGLDLDLTHSTSGGAGIAGAADTFTNLDILLPLPVGWAAP